MIFYAKAELLLKILKIFDNIQRAEKEIPQQIKNSSWIKGFEMIKTQFKKFLESEEVEEIETENKKFDPNFHEAVEEVEKEGKEKGEIVEVVEKGYLFKGQLIRPAKVKVAK